MRRLVSAALVAVLLGAAAVAGDDAAKDDEVVWRLGSADGRAATAEEVQTVIRVLAKRLDGVGLAGITLSSSATDGRITMKLPAALVASRDSIGKFAERPGTLEFRIRAAAAEERDQRDVRALKAPSPPDRRWVPCKHGGRDMLVQVPEEPLLAKLRQLDKAGVTKDAAEYVAAKKAYDEVLREEVFTGDQIARVEVRRMISDDVVYFEFKEERKPYFAAFTEKHVNEPIAIILDGKVECVPVIKSSLPGNGIISGGGPTGFTEREAKELVAILASGALPVSLVRVPAAETK